VSGHEFATVYDISTAGFQYLAPLLIGVAFILISVVLFVARDSPIVRATQPFPQWPTLLPLVFGGFALVWTVVLFAPAMNQYFFLRGAESRKQYYEVIGRIEGFHPWVPHVRPETFRVKSVQFSFTGADLTPGFRETTYPLLNGDCVRIWYVGSAIIRFDKEGGALGTTTCRS
jgi:hypothetical protein